MAIEPARFGMPDASTAGVQAGVTLTPYTGPMGVTTPGTLIEGKTINGQLTVKAADVTIRNCRIQVGDWWGVEGEHSPNIHVEHCDIIGGNLTNSGILGSGTFIGNDISHVSIGIQLTNEGASTVRDNYVHDLFYGSSDPHYDGITLFGGQDNVLIEHNTFSVPTDGGTASIIMGNNFGHLPSNVTINNNLMYGTPSYTIYSNGTNVKITNNYIAKGKYGYFSITGQEPSMANNTLWQEGVDPTPYPTSKPDPVDPDPVDLDPVDPAEPSPPNRLVLTGLVVASAPLPFSLSVISGKVDLSAVDAKAGTSGNQAFTFLGQGAFSVAELRSPGRLRYHFETDAKGNDLTVVEGTTNGTGGVDFSLYLLGRLTLTEADFVL